MAFKDGATYLVEPLELQREHVSAQLAYVVEDYRHRCAPGGAGET